MQDGPRLEQEGLTRRRKPDKAAGSLEQLHAENLLQLLYLPAKRRLGHIQSKGGAAEVQLLRECHKGTELGQFEHGSPCE
jgi:hypothetical protein